MDTMPVFTNGVICGRYVRAKIAGSADVYRSNYVKGVAVGEAVPTGTGVEVGVSGWVGVSV